MFTGIVEKTCRVIGAADGPGFRRITLAADWKDVRPGESIAINGCCLTVADIQSGELGFDVIPETLDKTNLGQLQNGDAVNVERSLKLGDRIDGHFVQGHIDGTATLADVKFEGPDRRLTLHAPDHLAKYLIPKGSVTLDGVSLTITSVQGNVFEVALIPTTLQLTTLGNKSRGWMMNMEADVLSKTIVAWLERQAKI